MTWRVGDVVVEVYPGAAHPGVIIKVYEGGATVLMYGLWEGREAEWEARTERLRRVDILE